MIVTMIWTICAWGLCYGLYRIMLVYAEMRLRLANAATAPPERKAPLPPVVRMYIVWIVAAMGVMNAVAAVIVVQATRRAALVVEARCTPENCRAPKKCNGNTCTAQAQTDLAPPTPPPSPKSQQPSQPTSSTDWEYAAGSASSLQRPPDGIN